ncbi:unnamed protein product [Bursaphelenchus okinawaensis]|uniref:Uncharacterized protein n=1 Tax=Bursaphelenchus okinawaensis TaxID=465554 RepID=A0A811JQA0_9BILA|nr:unnamed protein product [Bursaphelenchus okinawaensis]CAG9076894.1 unnamed protein product [Bursaphelenchus okinawaensis]
MSPPHFFTYLMSMLEHKSKETHVMIALPPEWFYSETKSFTSHWHKDFKKQLKKLNLVLRRLKWIHVYIFGYPTNPQDWHFYGRLGAVNNLCGCRIYEKIDIVDTSSFLPKDKKPEDLERPDLWKLKLLPYKLEVEVLWKAVRHVKKIGGK